MTDPALFDRTLQSLRIARAKRIGFADVLHRRAADEIRQKLNEVNRSFRDIVIVSDHGDLWCEETGLNAKIVPPHESLGLPEASADLVIFGLTLHSANDPVGQLIQARRALRPDGLCLAALFAENTLGELRAALTEAEAEVRGGLAPRVAPMADIRSLGALISRAGLTLPVADRDSVTLTYASALHLMHDLRAMAETNILTAQERGFLPRRVLLRTLELYAQRFSGVDERIRASFDLVYLTGWAPDASQPQPLRPGSAQMRLADALGTLEHSTGETAEGKRKQ